MSPNSSPTYLLTAAEVLPRPEEAVREAVEDVQGQLKQIVVILKLLATAGQFETENKF